MAIGTPTTGTLTCSGSEQTLGTAKTDAKTYVVALDLVNMAAGDVIELYTYVKAISGSTARVAWKAYFAGAQGVPNYQSPPVPAPYSVEFKLKQPTGSARNVDWAIFSID